MKKKTRITLIIVAVVLLVLMLIPIPLRLKDGGTTTYQAVLYSVSTVRRIGADPLENGEYREFHNIGTVVKILGLEVFNNVITVYKN